MKKIIILLCLFACVAAMAMAQAKAGGTMYVAIKKLDLKSSTGVFAKTQATLQYGAQVTIVQISGKWAQVRLASDASQTGWTATANLTAKRVVEGASATASAQEVALAGKGFSEEVENAYKANGKLNYADVDRTEQAEVPLDELEAFIREGQLSMGDN